jgi:hypothetical protein
VEQRAAAAVAAMKGSIEREDLHQMETFSQLKTIRALLAARARWDIQPSCTCPKSPSCQEAWQRGQRQHMLVRCLMTCMGRST